MQKYPENVYIYKKSNARGLRLKNGAKLIQSTVHGKLHGEL